jgi:hypothetical protein
MPEYTQARIRQLCAQALAVEDQEKSRHILRELRAAIESHQRLAKASLGCQKSALESLQPTKVKKQGA